MASRAEMSEQEILKRLRQHVEAKSGLRVIKAQDEALASAGPEYDLSISKRIEKRAEHFQKSFGQINPRPAGPHNALIQGVKKIIRRTVTWYMRPIQGMTDGLLDLGREHTRLLTLLAAQQQALAGEQRGLAAELKNRFISAESSLADLHARQLHFDQLRPELAQLLALHIEERLRRLEMWLRKSQQQAPAATQAATDTSRSAPAPSGGIDFDYFLFEQYYRGSESLIKDRQREYLDIFRGRTNVLDLGCGRGEFLELMREIGVEAHGVEYSQESVLLCQEKGLRVSRGDLLEYLGGLKDESIGGIFSAQVIEHLPVELQLRYVELAQRKLMPGAPLVLETINPQCVFALVRNFYLDPTHVRPVHPEFLKFVLESKGFEKVAIRFSGRYDEDFTRKLENAHADSEEIKEAILKLNDFCFGYQDYAAIGWRA